MKENIPLLKPLNKTKLYEEIVEQLTSRIINRDIEPGEKLPAERNLAEMLGVNRSTVREALRKLESMELLEIKHGEGVYVRDYLESGNLELIKAILFRNGSLDSSVFKNLLDLRSLIVPEMAGCAAKNRTDEDLVKLEQIIFNDKMPVGERDLRLHNAIARASGNVLFVVLLNAFTSQAKEFYDIYFVDDENKTNAPVFHRAIFQAIKNQEPGNARKIMQEVLKAAGEKILKILDSNENKFDQP